MSCANFFHQKNSHIPYHVSMMINKNNTISQFLWDLWCTVSLIGIWPRFIEPNLISLTRITLPIAGLKESASLKIVQFSDLHFNLESSDHFLNKLTRKILNESPDVIVFTGDFLCYSKLEEADKLKKFLNNLHAPYGCFAILGNHDYENFVSINENGEYDVINNSASTLTRGFKRLFSKIKLIGKVTDKAKNTNMHPGLLDLIKETPFQLLHNETKVLTIKGIKLNLCGLGEYSLGKCLPEKAFEHYNIESAGIILSHNPDSLSLLKDYPGDIILSGHTHGGQINLPGFREKFLALENPKLKRGLVTENHKKIYINRGIGSVMKFRWFSMPEILSLTLTGKET